MAVGGPTLPDRRCAPLAVPKPSNPPAPVHQQIPSRSHHRQHRFTVKSFNPSCGVATTRDRDFVPRSERYRRYVYQDGERERIRAKVSCRKVWSRCNVFSNGDVVPCGYDYDAQMRVGNIGEQPFRDIWNGPAFRELRRKLHEDKDVFDVCRSCTVNFERNAGVGWILENHDLTWPGRVRRARALLRPGQVRRLLRRARKAVRGAASS